MKDELMNDVECKVSQLIQTRLVKGVFRFYVSEINQKY